MNDTERISIDCDFWGIRLLKPHEVLTVPMWDFEQANLVICGIVRLCGVDIAESFLGVVLPTVLRDRENVEQVAAAPEQVRPELRMHRDGSRWADVRVALESRLPNLRETLGHVVAAMTSPDLLPSMLGGMETAQSAQHQPVSIINPATRKILPRVFPRHQDVYAAVLAAGMENLFPLQDAGRQARGSQPKPASSFPPILHWRAYRAQ